MAGFARCANIVIINEHIVCICFKTVFIVMSGLGSKMASVLVGAAAAA